MKIKLYLTRRKEAHCLATFVFWRAFLALQKKQEQSGSNQDMILDAPMTVSYKRPDIKGTLKEAGRLAEKDQPVSVYSCAPNSLNEQVRGICKDVSKELLVKFDFYPEIFT